MGQTLRSRSFRVIVVFGSINLDLVFRTAVLPREGETVLTDGFEQEEMTGPRAALEESGVIIRMLSDKTGHVRGVHHDQPGDLFDVDTTLDRVTAELEAEWPAERIADYLDGLGR